MRTALLAMLPSAYLTGLIAASGTALYVNMSAGDCLSLVVAAWLLIWTTDVVFEARLILRLTPPITQWVGGERGESETVSAWRAAVGMPYAFLRQPGMYLAVFFGIVLWDLFAVWQLDLPGYSAAIFLPGSLIVYVYWVLVRFLAIELTLRPVLEDIAAALPVDTPVDRVRIPLQTRLLVALPVVSLITGIAVGGFSADDSADLGNFGLALLGATVATALVASWLIVFLSASITVPIGLLRDAARRVGEGDFSARVPVASSDETAELWQAFNEMVTGLGERERLREAFGTFVDPQLAERIEREGTDLAGEEVEVSILFMDIRGFTSYSEKVRVQEAVARLNDVYGRVVPIITSHGGHANKFIGDGLLAVFGAPARLDDHAGCAVAASLEIADTVREAYGGDLRVGVGVNSGLVMSGTIGGGGRLDFTVIGDVVNTASRVESATRQTGDDVLITQATRDQLRGDVGFWKERPPIPLKGKSKEIRLFAPA